MISTFDNNRNNKKIIFCIWKYNILRLRYYRLRGHQWPCVSLPIVLRHLTWHVWGLQSTWSTVTCWQPSYIDQNCLQLYDMASFVIECLLVTHFVLMHISQRPKINAILKIYVQMYLKDYMFFSSIIFLCLIKCGTLF